MVDRVQLQGALDEFVQALPCRYDIGRVLYRLTDHCVSVLECDGAGVAIAQEEDGLESVAATDDRIARVEERQVRSDEGPCHDAHLSGRQVTSCDLEIESRWCAYRGEALRQGIRAVVGVPLIARGTPLGALNIYWFEPREPDGDLLEVAQLLADMAAAYLVNLSVLADTEQLNAQLQEALDSRVVIEQAKGIIAERHGLDAAEAFRLLRQHARSNREDIHSVAAAVVEGCLELAGLRSSKT